MKFNILEILIFINQAVYCYSIVPLIQENYRLKTARGLSDSLVIGFLNAFIAMLFYFFCLGLPISYRISVITQAILVSIIIGQRFWYDAFSHKKLLGFFYLGNFFTAITVIPAAFIWPHQVGNIAGWIGLFLIIANRIPQIIKIEREKSVYGFSYNFAALLGVAAVMEIAIVLWYQLPVQTLLTASWALLSFFIFSWQFYKFSWKKPTLPC